MHCFFTILRAYCLGGTPRGNAAHFLTKMPTSPPLCAAKCRTPQSPIITILLPTPSPTTTSAISIQTFVEEHLERVAFCSMHFPFHPSNALCIPTSWPRPMPKTSVCIPPTTHTVVIIYYANPTAHTPCLQKCLLSRSFLHFSHNTTTTTPIAIALSIGVISENKVCYEL